MGGTSKAGQAPGRCSSNCGAAVLIKRYKLPTAAQKASSNSTSPVTWVNTLYVRSFVMAGFSK